MSGMTLVVAGNPDGSLIIRKLTDPMPPCGSYMPLTGEMPLAATNPALVMRLRAWIMAGAMKPRRVHAVNEGSGRGGSRRR